MHWHWPPPLELDALLVGWLLEVIALVRTLLEANALLVVPILLVVPPQLPLKQSVVEPKPMTPLQCINSLLPPPPQEPLV